MGRDILNLTRQYAWYFKYENHEHYHAICERSADHAPLLLCEKIEVEGINIRSDMFISNRKCDQVLVPSAQTSEPLTIFK